MNRRLERIEVALEPWDFGPGLDRKLRVSVKFWPPDETGACEMHYQHGLQGDRDDFLSLFDFSMEYARELIGKELRRSG